MPTGYTSKMYEGEPQTFEEFVLSCSRAFGYCIEQRDESMSVPPRKATVAQYYYDSVTKATDALYEWEHSTESQRRQEYAKYVEEVSNSNIKSAHDALRRWKAYTNMLDKVNEWNAPSTWSELKKFMIEQIESSIKFDTDPFTQVVVTYETWARDRSDHLYYNLNYTKKQLAEQKKRIKTQNIAIESLYKSLGLEYNE